MVKDVNKLFGAKIKEYRIKRNLTQWELSGLVEVDQKHISRIECGKSFPSAKVLEKLAEALKVEPKDLFEFYHLQDDKNLKKDIVSMVNNLKSEDLSLVYKFIRTFVL